MNTAHELLDTRGGTSHTSHTLHDTDDFPVEERDRTEDNIGSNVDPEPQTPEESAQSGDKEVKVTPSEGSIKRQTESSNKSAVKNKFARKSKSVGPTLQIKSSNKVTVPEKAHRARRPTTAIKVDKNGRVCLRPTKINKEEPKVDHATEKVAVVVENNKDKTSENTQTKSRKMETITDRSIHRPTKGFRVDRNGRVISLDSESAYDEPTRPTNPKFSNRKTTTEKRQKSPAVTLEEKSRPKFTDETVDKRQLMKAMIGNAQPVEVCSYYPAEKPTKSVSRRIKLDANQNKVFEEEEPSFDQEDFDDYDSYEDRHGRKSSPMAAFKIRSNEDKAEVVLAGTSTAPFARETALQALHIEQKKEEAQMIIMEAPEETDQPRKHWYNPLSWFAPPPKKQGPIVSILPEPVNNRVYTKEKSQPPSYKANAETIRKPHDIAHVAHSPPRKGFRKESSNVVVSEDGKTLEKVDAEELQQLVKESPPPPSYIHSSRVALKHGRLGSKGGFNAKMVKGGKVVEEPTTVVKRNAEGGIVAIKSSRDSRKTEIPQRKQRVEKKSPSVASGRGNSRLYDSERGTSVDPTEFDALNDGPASLADQIEPWKIKAQELRKSGLRGRPLRLTTRQLKTAHTQEEEEFEYDFMPEECVNNLSSGREQVHAEAIGHREPKRQRGFKEPRLPVDDLEDDPSWRL